MQCATMLPMGKHSLHHISRLVMTNDKTEQSMTTYRRMKPTCMMRLLSCMYVKADSNITSKAFWSSMYMHGRVLIFEIEGSAATLAIV